MDTHPGAGGNAEKLRRYWAEGPGAAKIRWGAPGDFDRCVRHLDKHMPGRAEGYCNLLHKRALGYYPATHARMTGLAHDGGHVALAFDPSQQRDPQGTTTGGRFTADPAQARKTEAQRNLKTVESMNPSDRDEFLAKLSPEQLRAMFFELGEAAAPPWLKGLVYGEMARRGMTEQRAPAGDYDFRTKAEKAADKKKAAAAKKAAKKKPAGAKKPAGRKGSGASKSGKSPRSSGSKPSSTKKKAASTPKPKPKPPPKPESARTYQPLGGGPPVTVTATQRRAGTTPSRVGRDARGGRARRSYSADHPGVIELAGPSTSARRVMARDGRALDDGSFPIPDVAHLHKAMRAFGRCPPAKRARLVAHIRRRARALGVIGDERVAAFLTDHAAGATKTA